MINTWGNLHRASCQSADADRCRDLRLTLVAARCASGMFLLVFAGCSSSNGPAAAESFSADGPVAIKFPDGDPAVPAVSGGPGFNPAIESGWITSTDFPLEGSPRAVKGGAVRYWMRFPLTLRTLGKDSNAAANQLLEQLCYEPLLTRHSQTLEFVPRLATHWWISDDKRTFRYRLNPRAHWSDGRPVTANDVVATWQLLNDTTILQPSMQMMYGQFERPAAVAKYVVEVRAKLLSWRNFVYFSMMTVLPAHELAGLTGGEFLARHQFQPVIGSGPYILRQGDAKKGHYLTLRRRHDYWGRDQRFAKGRYNFDLIRLVSTEDSVLALEKAKKGEIDIFPVGKAKDWAVDLPRLDQVQRGLLVMRQIENDKPAAVDGIVMNMRVAPLDDVRVRKALAFLYNRRKLIDKLFYGHYTHLDSYFPGSVYADPDIAKVRYDPDEVATPAARSRLANAGSRWVPHQGWAAVGIGIGLLQ